MKRKKFDEVFLLAAVVLFVASGRSIWASILLMLASLYMICSVVPELWKEVKDARRKSK